MIDPERDALVIVDVQNDFCPDGALGVPGGHEVVDPLNRYATRFAEARAPVFASRDWHPRHTKHFKEHGGLWPPHCVQGSPGADFHPALRLPRGTAILSKGMDPEEDAYSCFQARDERERPFPEVLKARGVERLFIGGLATDYCVKATALDAIGRGLDVVVLEDAIRAVDLEPGDGKRAIDAMKAAGASFATLDSLASDGGAPAPRRPAARPASDSLASDGGAPAPRRPAARPATPGRAAARTAAARRQ